MLLTFEEIVDDVFAKDPEGMKALACMKKEDLSGLHFTVGRDIRNTYGLWQPNHPAVGPTDHPDDVSAEIIRAVWRKARGEQSPAK